MNTLLNKLRAFHHDERGAAGALEDVMKLAVAALVIVALIAVGRYVMNKLNETVPPIVDDSAIPKIQ